jgi:hypothetical protein
MRPAAAARAPVAVTGLTNAIAHDCTLVATNTERQQRDRCRQRDAAGRRALTLIGVVSQVPRGRGPFDVVVDRSAAINGAVQVEPRAADAGGSGHAVVFQFNAPVTSVTGAARSTIRPPRLPAAPRQAPRCGGHANRRGGQKRVTVSVPTVNGTAVNASASRAIHARRPAERRRQRSAADVSAAGRTAAASPPPPVSART